MAAPKAGETTAQRIVPPNPLKNAVREVRPGEGGDPVARAEQALAALASEFPAWMQSECTRLDQALRAFHAARNPETRQALFIAAHDIKGEAGTFGFPHAAEVAASLCRLMDYTPELARIPTFLIDQHVQSIQAITRETAMAGAAGTATELVRRLREVTDDFLIAENHDRPEVLEIVQAPSIAPEA